MIKLNILDAERDFEKLVESCIHDDEVVYIKVDKENVVMINEDLYNSLVESLHLAHLNSEISEVCRTESNEFLSEPPWYK